jgi:histidinol-phosphate aminotransferase
MGSHDAIKPLEACRQSGEVAGPSMHAASVLMDHWDSHVRPGIADVVAGRDWLCDQLSADGYKVRGEHANHVLVDCQSALNIDP